ncbi:MAG: glycosyltransferase [Desulfohalobiaceae bacterium]|nr:glycosyltransferase [Desulfohalobiaceae bacterium]
MNKPDHTQTTDEPLSEPAGGSCQQTGLTVILLTQDPAAERLERLLSDFLALNTWTPVEILILDQGEAASAIANKIIPQYAAQCLIRHIRWLPGLTREACLSKARYPRQLLIQADQKHSSRDLEEALQAIGNSGQAMTCLRLGEVPRFSPKKPIESSVSTKPKPQPGSMDRAMGPLTARDIEAVRKSGLIDETWYLQHYPDVAAAGMDPVEHYLRHGIEDGRDPGPCFAAAWYEQKYEEARQSGLNPVLHYVRSGKDKGYLPRPELRPSLWWSGLSPEAEVADQGCMAFRGGVQRTLHRLQTRDDPPVIIIPVYNAVEELEACLQALLQNTRGTCRVIVIDDASPDLRVQELLQNYSRTSSLEIYANQENQGFTRTMNRGLELAGRSDAVFLNSDTQVTQGWLRNLQLAVYSHDRVGTATPLSNNAGAFSAPRPDQVNAWPQWLDLQEVGRAVYQVSGRIYPRVPTGNGFCMYIRRDCLDETGLLDAEAFPRGYGEENDWCLRAGRQGWQHVIDDATWIYHVRAVSFAGEKTELIRQGRRIIDKRYPEYSQAVREAFSSPALQQARRRIQQTLESTRPADAAVKPRLLYVISSWSGGVPQTNLDLMRAMAEQAETFVLHCDARRMSLYFYEHGDYVQLQNHELKAPIQAFPHTSGEYDETVARWLIRYGLELVHIRHIAWHSLGLVPTAKALGLPVVFSVHDFYAICPTVKLLDENLRFCGGRCTSSEGWCRPELWTDPEFPSLKHGAIRTWQQSLLDMLGACDALVSTTQHVRDLVLQVYPALQAKPFEIIPHGRDFQDLAQLASSLQPNGLLRILIPGNISLAKGGGILADLIQKAGERAIELHVMGKVAAELDLGSAVVLHGPYRREDFAQKVQEIKPHLGGIFSIWPETHSHTLTELWSCGLPVLGFDLGAVGERIRQTGGGWLAASLTAQAILDLIEQLRQNPARHEQALGHIQAWQRDSARKNTCSHMAKGYWAIYSSLHPGLEKKSPPTGEAEVKEVHGSQFTVKNKKTE